MRNIDERGAKMKTGMVFLCAILSVTLYGCGNAKKSSDSSTNNDLTTQEIDSINRVMISVVNTAGATTTGSAQVSVNLPQSTALGAITFSTTCNANNYQLTAAVNDSMACPTAGHITYTGNLKTYCSSWTYHTSPAVYCSCNSDWNTYNALTFNYGDRTNNLNDCETNGIIIDGTVYSTAIGKISDISMTLSGTLTVNRRGSSGGLVPLNSCSIFLQYRSSTGKWSGTLCGRSVS